MCHIKGGRKAITGAMALPLGLHFKGEEQFLRFTSKQPDLVPLHFLCDLLRTTQCCQQLGPKSKSTSHGSKSFTSPLRNKWVLVRLQIVQSKAHTDCTWSRTKAAQPMWNQIAHLAYFFSTYPSICFDYAFLKIFQHFFLAALFCVPGPPVHIFCFIRMNLGLAQAGVSWSRGSHQETMGNFHKLAKRQCYYWHRGPRPLSRESWNSEGQRPGPPIWTTAEYKQPG